MSSKSKSAALPLKRLRRFLRKGLDHLHRRQAGIHHQLHLMMFRKALNEVALRVATAVGAQGDADASVHEFLEIDAVGFE